MGPQLIPDGNSKVFCATHLVLHEFNIHIEVAVIYFFNYLFLDDVAQLFYVKYKSCSRIRLPLYRYQQFIVMTVPILIGAFAKNLFILFVRPVRVVEFMGSIKML